MFRNKSLTFINVLGLSVGIATCLIILLFVQNELSFDQFNEKADRIVRVIFKASVGGGQMNEPHVMPPVAAALKKEFPEVESATRLRIAGKPRFTYQDKSFNEDEMAYVDSNFFHVFSIPFLEGNLKTALLEPNSIVISKNVASKYFGKEDPIGKLIYLKANDETYKVTAVFNKVPVNAHFHFELFASMKNFPDANQSSWMVSEFYTYLVLPKNYDYKTLEAKLPNIVEKYMGPQMQQAMNMNVAEFKKKGYQIGLFLQPITDIHLHSNFAYDLSLPGNINYIYIFSAIALFMLLIACINFMNLSTASASKRAKEVGIRKVLGSIKSQLIKQFIFESAFTVSVALAIAIVITYITLPFFNQLSGKELSLNFLEHPWIIFALCLLGIVTTLLAGSYPAFYLASFNPISVLKGRFTKEQPLISFRSGLVVFQFFIAVAMIFSTIVVYQQMNFIQNKDLGFNKEQVLILPIWQLGNKATVLNNKFLHDPRIISTSYSSYIPVGNSNNNNFIIAPETNSQELTKTLRYDIDYQYIPTLGMKMVIGRNFSTDYATDSAGIILNETAIKIMGWEKHPLNHRVINSDNNGKINTYHVIGVVKDFHFKSLHQPISPLVMVLGGNKSNMIVKIKTTDIQAILTSIKLEWTKLNAEASFSYSFLDQRLTDTYDAEHKTGLLLGIFAILTILVACLGLFGLAMFIAEDRRKEIGIRKVLGATIIQVTSLLSVYFLKLIVFALLIAFPISWLLMNEWLNDFAYRTTIGWSVFLIASSLTIIIAICTISYQAIKTALSNPIKSLRTE